MDDTKANDQTPPTARVKHRWSDRVELVRTGALSVIQLLDEVAAAVHAIETGDVAGAVKAGEAVVEDVKKAASKSNGK